MYPNDEDVDLNKLSDLQMVQIFWSTLLLELTMLALLFNPDDSGGIISTIRDTVIVMTPCCAGAVVFRILYRWGNSGYRRPNKRENRRALQLKAGTATKGARSRLRRERAALRASLAVRSKKGDRATVTIRGARPPRYWKIALVWTFIVLVGMVCALSCIMFAAGFGNDATQKFVMDYFFGIFYSFGIVEPFEILMLVCLPFLMDNKLAVELRTQYKNLFG